jgi:hypothetical protein
MNVNAISLSQNFLKQLGYGLTRVVMRDGVNSLGTHRAERELQPLQVTRIAV